MFKSEINEVILYFTVKTSVYQNLTLGKQAHAIYIFFSVAKIENFIRRFFYIQLFYSFRIKFMKIAAHAHMNDLSIINLVLS